jgi:cyclic pyranopterin phosphate synthase
MPRLVRQLSDLGFDDVALTTNGMLLSSLATDLAAAGLRRVNISCDSLRAARFRAIRRRGTLVTVLRSMMAAEAAGLTPLQVHVVVVRGVNDDEILDFAAFGRSTKRFVRFIEFMPLDSGGSWDMQHLVPGEEILERISSRYPLAPIDDRDPRAPAQAFRYEDGGGEVGLIASVTQPFCADCDRLRLTADGAIRNCLFSHNEYDLRALLRQGGSDDDVARTFRIAVWGKQAGHQINQPGFVRPIRSMSMIGG